MAMKEAVELFALTMRNARNHYMNEGNKGSSSWNNTTRTAALQVADKCDDLYKRVCSSPEKVSLAEMLQFEKLWVGSSLYGKWLTVGKALELLGCSNLQLPPVQGQ